MKTIESNVEFEVNIEYLKNYKKEKGLTNKELAELIGIHESTMSRVLRGKKGVGYKFIVGALYRLKDIEIEKLLIKENKAG